MDKLEQKLKTYYQYHEEYQPEAISDGLIERLKALEASPEAAKKPRLRYVLPIAALLALAVGIGGWAILHTPRPGDATVASFTLEEQTTHKADSPAVPAPPDAKPPADAKPQISVEPVPEDSVSLTKPVQGGTAQPKSGDPAPMQPDEPPPATPNSTPQNTPGGEASEKPQNTTPAKPEDTAPVRPDVPTPAKPDAPTPANADAPAPVTPDDPTPVEPDDPAPPKPDDSNPPKTEDPDPPEVDPPDVPQIPPEIGVVYLNEGDRETLTLTLLSTGEIEEIDITGLLPFYPQTSHDPDSYWETPIFPATKIQYKGECNAFGWQISYSLTRSMSGSAKAEVTGLHQTEQAEKGENDET